MRRRLWILAQRNAPARLLESIQEVDAGGAAMSLEIARRVVGLFRAVRHEQSGYDLTPHELRILELFVEGESYRSAATDLGIAFHTVAFSRTYFYQELHVHSKSEVVQALGVAANPLVLIPP